MITRGTAEAVPSYQWPVFGIDAHGSAFSFAGPFCKSSMEMPSGDLMKAGITINRPPRDGNMAFVRSPDLHSIELLQKGSALPPKEPWASMPNTGHW